MSLNYARLKQTNQPVAIKLSRDFYLPDGKMPASPVWRQSVNRPLKVGFDIYAGLEMTAPGICGGISMEKWSAPVEVPDFRES